MGELNGISLTPAIARNYILESFSHRAQWTTGELKHEVVQRHRRAGGADARQMIQDVVNKALLSLKKSGFIRQLAYGFWKKTLVPDAGNSVETAPAKISSDNGIRVERTISEGPESIYVYYFENEKKVAKYEGRSVWECKIGKSTGDPIDRILNQSKTARHTLPIIALAIRCDDAEGTERLLHQFFRYAGVWKKNEGCGEEWFLTNPERVAACYLEIDKLAKTLAERSESPHQAVRRNCVDWSAGDPSFLSERTE